MTSRGEREVVMPGVWGSLALMEVPTSTSSSRTAVLSGLNSKPRLDVAAGGALTALSDTEEEWNEVVLKARAVAARGGGGVREEALVDDAVVAARAARRALFARARRHRTTRGWPMNRDARVSPSPTGKAP